MDWVPNPIALLWCWPQLKVRACRSVGGAEPKPGSGAHLGPVSAVGGWVHCCTAASGCVGTLLDPELPTSSSHRTSCSRPNAPSCTKLMSMATEISSQLNIPSNLIHLLNPRKCQTCDNWLPSHSNWLLSWWVTHCLHSFQWTQWGHSKIQCCLKLYTRTTMQLQINSFW